jgi:peptidoglycan hydrolase-like protein with peptidoglycan-binding domain
VQRVLQESGRTLTDSEQGFFAPRFGYDLNHVRVHTGDSAASAASDVRARAFAAGGHIVFGAGQYQPYSHTGRELMAHELAHTLQPASATLHRKPLPLTEDEKLEDLQSDRLKDDARLQEAFDNAPVMKKTETSEGVKTLQRALLDLNYSLPISFEKGDADGIYGDETRNQVKQFQRDHLVDPSGIVDRPTLRALDDTFNPVITLEKVYFGKDRGELVNNETDWTSAGAPYKSWAHDPYHVFFDGSTLVPSIPITVPAGDTMTAYAKVNIRGGIPGKEYSISATPTTSQAGWTLTGTAPFRQGFDTDYVLLTGSAPLPNQHNFSNFVFDWTAVNDAGRTTMTAQSRLKVFATAGAAHNVGVVDRGETPNVPTFKRLRQAMKFAKGAPANRPDKVVYAIFRKFPNYGVCDVPAWPNSYGISCPTVSSIWGMSDHVSTGNWQCSTIASYANAVLNVLGVPHAVPDMVVQPVVIWADPATKEQGRENVWPHPGINIPSITHPQHRDWALGLLDGNCGINNYEACVKLRWQPLGASTPITQYYCGGLGDENPPEGFKTPREVLDSAFILTYFVRMRTNDPNTGFPRGIRKKDVKVYDESGSCHDEM